MGGQPVVPTGGAVLVVGRQVGSAGSAGIAGRAGAGAEAGPG